MNLRVYGASDDLVEVEGDVTEEFGTPYPDDRLFLTFSNGVVLVVEYGAGGEWRVTELYSPEDVGVTVHGPNWADAPKDYSETAVVEGDDPVEWIITAEDIHRFDEGDA